MTDEELRKECKNITKDIAKAMGKLYNELYDYINENITEEELEETKEALELHALEGRFNAFAAENNIFTNEEKEKIREHLQKLKPKKGLYKII